MKKSDLSCYLYSFYYICGTSNYFTKINYFSFISLMFCVYITVKYRSRIIIIHPKLSKYHIMPLCTLYIVINYLPIKFTWMFNNVSYQYLLISSCSLYFHYRDRLIIFILCPENLHLLIGNSRPFIGVRSIQKYHSSSDESLVFSHICAASIFYDHNHELRQASSSRKYMTIFTTHRIVGFFREYKLQHTIS